MLKSVLVLMFKSIQLTKSHATKQNEMTILWEAHDKAILTIAIQVCDFIFDIILLFIYGQIWN